MTRFLCKTCGTAYPPSPEPPPNCPICEDERQYVGFDGQQWLSVDELRREHHNEFEEEEASLTSIRTVPTFAIGQRAFLLQSASGNLLWDCLSLLDAGTVDRIRTTGGLKAIAISHPHYYTTMQEWSRAFGGVPIYLHRADARWVMDPGDSIVSWEGDRLALHDGITLVRGGGHFDGGSMCYWPAGSEGRGVLLSGDIIQVVPDTRWVSFMYSYPNLIPLSAAAVRQVAASVEDLAFDRIYGAFHPRTVRQDAKQTLARSVARYVQRLA